MKNSTELGSKVWNVSIVARLAWRELRKGVKSINLLQKAIVLPFCLTGCFEKEEENDSWSNGREGNLESFQFSLTEPSKSKSNSSGRHRPGGQEGSLLRTAQQIQGPE